MHSAALVRFLRSIPRSDQPPAALAELAGDATPELLHGCALLLHMLGVVTLRPSADAGRVQVQAASQTAHYTLHSLAALMEAGVPAVPDWKTRGVEGGGALDTGARFLYALEGRRLAATENPPPVRQVKAAAVLIKRDTPRPELLFQFDHNAGQYQLIGGRWSEQDGDDLLQTMVREIEEELPRSPLAHGRDYTLQLITDELRLGPVLSPTFGALTGYHFAIYHMNGLQQELRLGPDDCWAAVDDVLAGYATTPDGTRYPFNFTGLYEAINSVIPGGLHALPSSFQPASPSS